MTNHTYVWPDDFSAPGDPKPVRCLEDELAPPVQFTNKPRKPREKQARVKCHDCKRLTLLVDGLCESPKCTARRHIKRRADERKQGKHE